MFRANCPAKRSGCRPGFRAVAGDIFLDSRACSVLQIGKTAGAVAATAISGCEAAGAADCLERKDLEEKVQACIGGFADDLRDALHIPEGTVHPRLDRARHAPQDCLVKVPGGTR